MRNYLLSTLRVKSPDTAVLTTVTPGLADGWSSDGVTWRTTSNGVLAWGVPSLARHDVWATVTGPGTVDLMVRQVDAGNYWRVRWDPSLGSTCLWRVKDGVEFRVVESRRVHAAVPSIRVGLDGDVIVLYAPDGSRVASTTDSTHRAGTGIALRRTVSQATPLEVRAVMVAPRVPEGIAFPGEWTPGTLDIPLGAKGTWEDTDINNPNVVSDPSGTWWMNYTGYSAGRKGYGVQDAGLASAPSLYGPWTKHPNNPVFEDDSAGLWSQNGGFVRRPDGTWLLAYSAAGGQEAWFATAPSPWGPWTKQTWGRFPASDPHLRYREDGKLECTFYRDSYGIGWPGWEVFMRTSSDHGRTWSERTKLLGSMPVHWVQGGEPSVVVPPGMEDRVKLIAVDYMPDGDSAQSGRGTMLNITRDNGRTWVRHLLNRRSYTPGAFDEYAAFDSSMVYDATQKRLVMYYGGAQRPDNQTLGIGIQIGHKWAPWDPTGM